VLAVLRLRASPLSPSAASNGMDFALCGGMRRRRRPSYAVPFIGFLGGHPAGKRGRRMAYRLFDSLLDVSAPSRRTKRRLTLPVSIGIHVLVLGAGIIVPMLIGDLPAPTISGAIKAFVVEAAPPPPPPPPPPAAAPRPTTAPKVPQARPVIDRPTFT